LSRIEISRIWKIEDDQEDEDDLPDANRETDAIQEDDWTNDERG
jgi:hypothetical protein